MSIKLKDTIYDLINNSDKLDGKDSSAFSLTSHTHSNYLTELPSHTHNYASTIKIGTTSYNSSNNIISLPSYPTLSSLGAAASSHTHSQYLPLAGGTMTGGLGINSKYLIKPVAEYVSKSNSVTGAIRILLPSGITDTMTSMWIDVYNYSTETSFSVHVGGYTYTSGGGNTWQHNPFAMVYGANHKVRLGYTSGGRFCIYIGETTSSWAYPQIIVRDVIVGFTETSYTYWKNAWTIDFATTLENVTATCSNYALTTKNYGSLVATKSHTHSNLIIQGNGTSLGTYTGGSAVTVNLTYSNVGAAASSHTHSNYALSSHTHTFASLTSKPTTLSGYGITDAYTPARFGGTSSHSGYYKIKINSTKTWMIAFRVRVYKSYQYFDIRFSGYQYGTNYWYTPVASLVDGDASITVYFGYDSANNLWVGIPAGNYTGIEIVSAVNGYTQHEYGNNLNSLFTISNVSSLSTIQSTQTIYPSSKTNHTHNYAGSSSAGGAATSAEKLTTVSKTAWGQTYWTSAGVPTSISGAMTSVSSITFNNENSSIIYNPANEAALHAGTSWTILGYGTCGAGKDTYIDGNNLRFRTSTGWTERMIINSSGNVGIGTTSPSYPLHVSGSIYATSWLRTYGSTGWYSETYAGGWYMTDANWIKNYNNKPLFININTNNAWGGGGHRLAAVFYGSSHVSIGLSNSSISWYLCSNSNGHLYFSYRPSTSTSDTSNDSYKYIFYNTGELSAAKFTGSLNGSADMVDGYHISVVSALPSSPGSTTIYYIV